VVGFILSDQANVTHQPDISGVPIYIASDWVQEHVSYQFADGLIVPVELPSYQLQYINFDRATLDEFARQFNPVLLESVTQTGDTFLYQTPDQSLNVQQQEDGSVNFEYHLFQTPQGAEYAAQNNTVLTHADQKLVVQSWLERQPQFITGYQAELLNMIHGDTVETLYLSAADGGYRFEVANFGFYNGQLQTIYGSAITGVNEVGAATYGTNAEIERYLNTNPAFPYHSNTFPDEVDVHYQLTGFRQSPLGLEIDFEMEDPEATREALNILHPGFVGEGSAYGTLAIGNKEEQAAALAKLERYQE
jgi:hypothetical protein